MMASTAPLSAPSQQLEIAPELKRIANRFVSDIHEDLAKDKLIFPSVPSVVVKIRKVMEDPDASVNEITRAISLDPALSAKLLKVANSVFYANASPCRDLRSAVIRLGADAIEHAVMLLVVARVFAVGERRRIQPYLARLWRHSVLVASISERLADRIGQLEADVALLAGLVHDLGKVPVLVRAEKVPQLLTRREIIEPLALALHCKVGRAMLAAWRFPPELVAVADAHEDFTRASDGPADYLDLVMVANLMSYAGTSHPYAAVDWAEVPAARKLGVDAHAVDEVLEGARPTENALRTI